MVETQTIINVSLIIAVIIQSYRISILEKRLKER